MTPTERPRSRASAMRAETSVDLPEPGGPVIPTRWAGPPWGNRSRSAASATGVRFSTAVRIRASARRSPASAASARVAARAAGAAWPRAVTSDGLAGVRPEERRDLGDRRPGPEGRGHPGLLERRDIVVRDDPAHDDEDIVHLRLAQEPDDARDERHVGARQDREPHDVDILLERRRRDHLGGLAEAGVDDLEALVAQASGEDLRAAVVAVEPGLRDEDLHGSIWHCPDCATRPRGLRPLERVGRGG